MQVREHSTTRGGGRRTISRSPGFAILTSVVALLGLAAAGLGARALAEFQWDRFVGYRSPYIVNVPPGPETPPLNDEVVIVVVDGLRADVADTLPTFRQVAEEGSFLTARTARPSLSLPGWTFLTTGAPPQISGVTTNWYEGPVRVDSLFTSARRAGVTTAIVGGRSWGQLYGDVVTEGWFEAQDDAASDASVAEEAISVMRRLRPELLLVHLPDVDNVAHSVGVGPEYLEAAERADALIARIVDAAGRDATVILTSDHGHIDAGGHGGAEPEVVMVPLVVAGPGTTIGATGTASQGDVAPTVAAILGLSRPVHATGNVLEGLLDVGEEGRQRIEEVHSETEAEFYAAAASAIGGRRAIDAAAFRRVQEERARREALTRLPLTVIPLVAAALLVVLLTRRLHGGALLAGVVVFAIVWAALFLGRGLTFSFSHFNTEEQINAFLLARVVDSVIAALAGAVVTGGIAGRRRAGRWFAHGLGLAAWILLILSTLVGAFVIVYGWGFTWRLPNLSAAFAEYMALLAMFGIGAGAVLVGLLSAGSAWATHPRD